VRSAGTFPARGSGRCRGLQATAQIRGRDASRILRVRERRGHQRGAERASSSEKKAIADVIRQPVRYLVSSPFHDPFSGGTVTASPPAISRYLERSSRSAPPSRSPGNPRAPHQPHLAGTLALEVMASIRATQT
jgi:hypothetical protein